MQELIRIEIKRGRCDHATVIEGPTLEVVEFIPGVIAEIVEQEIARDHGRTRATYTGIGVEIIRAIVGWACSDEPQNDRVDMSFALDLTIDSSFIGLADLHVLEPTA